MKNIYAFAILVSMFFFFSSAPLRAANKYSLSLSSSFGILYGHSEEVLYNDDGDDDTYLSELKWDLKPLYYTGTALDFARTDPWERWGFFGGVSLKYGFPSKSGIMEDRDWMAESGNFLTHYSRHDSYSQGALLSDISLGLSFPFFDVLLLKTSIDFSYMYFSWLAQDGFYQYASKDSGGDYLPWTNDIPKKPLSGPGIIYSQNWFILSPVLAVEVKLSPRFFLDFYVAATPLTFCASIDEHLKAGFQAQDFSLWGLSLREGIGFAFVPKEKFEIRLDWGFRYISGTRGNSYIKETDDNAPNDYFQNGADGGAGLFALDVGVSAKIRL
ncbi:MAG: omptin family outer membrane protease [Treponema sp.]|jgi:hypothetical protein|nr:omptin family outer membrane protease [Treponema sp.]